MVAALGQGPFPIKGRRFRGAGHDGDARMLIAEGDGEGCRPQVLGRARQPPLGLRRQGHALHPERWIVQAPAAPVAEQHERRRHQRPHLHTPGQGCQGQLGTLAAVGGAVLHKGRQAELERAAAHQPVAHNGGVGPLGHPDPFLQQGFPPGKSPAGDGALEGKGHDLQGPAGARVPLHRLLQLAHQQGALHRRREGRDQQAVVAAARRP